MIYPEPGFPTYAAMIGTAVLPGMAFGAGGEGCLRLCFANSMQNLQIALEWMAEALGKLGTR